MKNLNKFTFSALQQCLFNSENANRILSVMNTKLSVQNAQHCEEVNALTNQINGLEKAQNNLTGYLEAGRATQTILNKIEKNEAELAILKAQLAAKKQEASSVGQDTYNQLVKQSLHYMCNEKTSEASALRDAAINRIEIAEDAVTIIFNEGVAADSSAIHCLNY